MSGHHPQSPGPPVQDDAGDDLDSGYQRWRDEQIHALDSDYRAWRQDRYKKFSEEFAIWHRNRRDPLGSGPGTAPRDEAKPDLAGDTRPSAPPLPDSKSK